MRSSKELNPLQNDLTFYKSNIHCLESVYFSYSMKPVSLCSPSHVHFNKDIKILLNCKINRFIILQNNKNYYFIKIWKVSTKQILKLHFVAKLGLEPKSRAYETREVTVYSISLSTSGGIRTLTKVTSLDSKSSVSASSTTDAYLIL